MKRGGVLVCVLALAPLRVLGGFCEEQLWEPPYWACWWDVFVDGEVVACELRTKVDGDCSLSGDLILVASPHDVLIDNEASHRYTIGLGGHIDTNDVCRVVLAGTNTIAITRFLGRSEDLPSQFIGEFVKIITQDPGDFFGGVLTPANWWGLGTNTVDLLKGQSTQLRPPGYDWATNWFGVHTNVSLWTTNSFEGGSNGFFVVVGGDLFTSVELGQGDANTFIAGLYDLVRSFIRQLLGFIKLAFNLGCIFGLVAVGMREVAKLLEGVGPSVQNVTSVLGTSFPALGFSLEAALRYGFVGLLVVELVAVSITFWPLYGGENLFDFVLMKVFTEVDAAPGVAWMSSTGAPTVPKTVGDHLRYAITVFDVSYFLFHGVRAWVAAKVLFISRIWFVVAARTVSSLWT